MKNSPNPLLHLLEMFIEGRFSSVLINFILIPSLILFVLLLPPISLADRIMGIGYTRIGPNGGSLTTEGMEVSFLPEGVVESFQAKLNVTDRSDFLEGSADNSLLTAAESIPQRMLFYWWYRPLETSKIQTFLICTPGMEKAGSGCPIGKFHPREFSKPNSKRGWSRSDQICPVTLSTSLSTAPLDPMMSSNRGESMISPTSTRFMPFPDRRGVPALTSASAALASARRLFLPRLATASFVYWFCSSHEYS